MAPIINHPPAWVYARINFAGEALGARYEASLYGPINAFLASYFLLERCFMTKPQPKIRPDYEVDPAEPQPRSSVDSYNSPVVSRADGGKEYPLREPDFITVKATHDIANDRVVLVVEVKPYGTNVIHARAQLEDYMETLAQKYRVDTDTSIFEHTLHGLLVIGNQVEMFTLNIADEIKVRGPRTFDHHDVKEFMSTLVYANW
jgi:hypothetical protein